MKIEIKTSCIESPVAIAKKELADYLSRVSPIQSCPEITIYLGIDKTLAEYEDAYAIDVDFQNNGGTIYGSNPRSVLFGSYKLLELIGIRWIRPGKDGEYIPDTVDMSRPFKIRSKAAYRHRGLCIEGAMSREIVLDTLQWMVRQGFNAYFIQFRNAYTFFARWYNHQWNPELAPEGFNDEKAAVLTRELQEEVKRYGMELQMVGHGWTCEPLGIAGREWADYQDAIPAGAEQYFAEINGKRELWGKIPLNTNLCYGNEYVRELITDDVVKYAEQNPSVDVIHFWLADGMNNQCECPKCTVKRPADWYIDLLNLADKKLTAIHSKVKIVFLIYVDLLWPPQESRLNNPDRFILMFAPITRSYSRPLIMPGDNTEQPIPEFNRNHLAMPTDPGMNVVFLRAWQKCCPVKDSFDFDYHFMWDHHKDPGMYEAAKTLYQDCRNLKTLNLDGFISCQSSRVFFPNGLGMMVLGRTLWNPETPFDKMAEDYFKSAYGDGWREVQTYFRKVSELFCPPLWRNEGTEQQKKTAADNLVNYEALVAEIATVLNRGMENANACWRESWSQLKLHIEICRLIIALLMAEWGGKGDRISAAEKLFAWVRKHELRLQSVLDVYEFLYAYKHAFKALQAL